jgi:hypothetical protein
MRATNRIKNSFPLLTLRVQGSCKLNAGLHIEQSADLGNQQGMRKPTPNRSMPLSAARLENKPWQVSLPKLVPQISYFISPRDFSSSKLMLQDSA